MRTPLPIYENLGSLASLIILPCGPVWGAENCIQRVAIAQLSLLAVSPCSSCAGDFNSNDTRISVRVPPTKCPKSRILLTFNYYALIVRQIRSNYIKACNLEEDQSKHRQAGKFNTLPSQERIQTRFSREVGPGNMLSTCN